MDATHQTRKEWPRGTFSRVGRRLRPQATPQSVRLVALGLRTSARISRALETERRRIEAKQEQRDDAEAGCLTSGGARGRAEGRRGDGEE